MYHDFVLVKKNKVSTEHKISKVFDSYFDENKENLPSIKIDDKIILYIIDTLKWIENDYCEEKKHKGLAYHGITLIKDKNAKKLSNIIKGWAILFAQGDEEFFLTGEYVLSGEEEYDEMTDTHYKGGEYEKIKVVKKKLLKDLKKLIELLEIAINDKEYCIVHMGI